MKKKILFVIPILGNGGAEKIITYLVNNISRDLFDINLLVFNIDKSDYINDVKDDVKIINPHRIKNKYIPDFFCTIIYAINIIILIRKIKPNVLFSGMVGFNIIVLIMSFFLQRKTKIIIRETCIVSEYIVSPVKRLLYKYLYKKSNVIIAQSEDMKDDLQNVFSVKNNILVKINNPIDTVYLDRKLSERDLDIFFPLNKINLVACGRLNRVKGFDSLIHYFSKIKNKDKYHLSIIGREDEGTNEESYLKELVRSYDLENYISFLGYQKNTLKCF